MDCVSTVVISLYYNFDSLNMNSSAKFTGKSRTIDCGRGEGGNLMPCEKMPSARFRRPKLMSNHRVMQKLFPVYRTIDVQAEVSHESKPLTRKCRPKLTDEQMFRLLLTRQREKYQQLLSKLGIQEKVGSAQVDRFLSCHE